MLSLGSQIKNLSIIEAAKEKYESGVLESDRLIDWIAIVVCIMTKTAFGCCVVLHSYHQLCIKPSGNLQRLLSSLLSQFSYRHLNMLLIFESKKVSSQITYTRSWFVFSLPRPHEWTGLNMQPVTPANCTQNHTQGVPEKKYK